MSAPLRFPRGVLVLDTETTGFNTQPAARIIELGACYVTPTGDLHAPVAELCCPATEIDLTAPGVAGALRCNGIAPEMFLRARPVGVVLGAFLGYWRGLGEPPVLAFPNVFERDMLSREGVTFPQWEHCLQGQGSAAAGRKTRISLRDLCALLGVPGEQPHRAAGDSYLEAQCFVSLVRRGLWPSALDPHEASG